MPAYSGGSGSFTSPSPADTSSQSSVPATQASTPPASTYLTGSPYGTAIPVLFGRCQLDGVPLWSGPLETTTADDGTSTQSVSFAVAFGHPSPLGLSATLKRLWINGTLVFDNTVSPLVRARGLKFRFHQGKETQRRDATIVKYEGKHNTTAFRGLIYIVIDDYPLTWTGGTYPVVSADISQSSSNQHLVTQWDKSKFTSYTYTYADWTNGLAYLFGNSGLKTIVDVFNMNDGSFVKQLDISTSRFDFFVGISYNDGPYIYLNNASTANENPIHMISKDSGEIVSEYIDTFPVGVAFGIKGVGNIDEFIIAGQLVFGGFNTYYRKGAKFDKYSPITSSDKISAVVWADVPGINVNDTPVVGKVDPPYVADSTDSTSVVPGADAYPTPADTTKFSIAYVATRELSPNKIRRVVFGRPTGSGKKYVPTTTLDSGALPVLNRIDAVFGSTTMADPTLGITLWPTVGIYNRKQFSLCLDEGLADVITLPSGYIVEAMYTGPATNPYLCVMAFDVTDPDTHVGHFMVFSTPWNVVLPSPQELAYNDVSGTPDGSEYTHPTAAFIAGAYDLLSDTVIPLMFNTGKPVMSMMQRQPGSDYIGYTALDGNYYVINLTSGDLTTHVPSDATYVEDDGTVIPSFHFNSANLYVESKNAVIYAEDVSGIGVAPYDWPGLVYLDGSNENNYTVQQYITELCVSAGLDQSKLSFTDVSTILIKGGIINQSVKLIDVLGQICELFRIDIVESSGFIKFKGKNSNGVTINRAFTQDELAFIDQTSMDDSNLLSNQMASTSSLPSILYLDYLDFDNSCLIGTQSVRRTKFPVPTTTSIATLTLSVPVVMDATAAAFWITRCIYDLWAGQLTNTFRIGVKDIALEPGDYVSITLNDGTVYTIKISETILNGDFSLSNTGATVSEKVVFHKPTVPPAGLRTKRLVSNDSFAAHPIGNLLLFASDTTTDDKMPYYWVATGQASLYQDGIAIGRLDTAPSIGTATTVLLPRGKAVHQIDDDTILYVSFPTGSPIVPFVDTDDAFMSGQNAALVSVGSNWELIYFRYLAASSDGVVIHHLIRGARGTDTFADGHGIGDIVVFFTKDNLSKLSIGTDQLYKKIALTAVPTGGTSVAQSNYQTDFVSTGGPFMPLAPMNLTATRDHISLDLTFTWQRRSRISGGMHDGDADQTLDEAHEEYILFIRQPDGVETTRVFSQITSETQTYTAAQQTLDGVSTSDTQIRAAVAQISAAVGQGYLRETTCQITLT